MKATSAIVLIDDNRAWLETLADFLRGKGYRVRTAQRGDRGLSLVQSPDTSLVIVDFHMPEMNGLELLRRLRRDRCNVAVLMLSSEDDPSLPGRAVAEGAAGFLSKTMAPGLLLRAFLQLVNRAGLSASDEGRPVFRAERLLPVPIRVRIHLPVPLSLLDPLRN